MTRLFRDGAGAQLARLVVAGRGLDAVVAVVGNHHAFYLQGGAVGLGVGVDKDVLGKLSRTVAGAVFDGHLGRVAGGDGVFGIRGYRAAARGLRAEYHERDFPFVDEAEGAGGVAVFLVEGTEVVCELVERYFRQFAGSLHRQQGDEEQPDDENRFADHGDRG